MLARERIEDLKDSEVCYENDTKNLSCTYNKCV